MKKTYKNIAVLVLALTMFSCFPKQITYLPKPNEFAEYTKGMWMECKLSDGSKVAGEILYLEKEELVLFTQFKVPRKVPKQSISSALVQFTMTTNSPERLKNSGLIPIITLSHGYWAVFTLPINLAIVMPIVNTHKKGAYAADYPAKIKWDELYKFARFPQGLPEGISYEQIVDVYR